MNGTNLIIPLPGPISAEDMAITGAGARLHAQDTSSISLLYDFEELEGELDYLTRVVALTFYPAVSGNPVTLGEVGSNFKIYISQCVKNQKSYFSLYMYMCIIYIYIYAHSSFLFSYT